MLYNVCKIKYIPFLKGGREIKFTVSKKFLFNLAYYDGQFTYKNFINHIIKNIDTDTYTDTYTDTNLILNAVKSNPDTKKVEKIFRTLF